MICTHKQSSLGQVALSLEKDQFAKHWWGWLSWVCTPISMAVSYAFLPDLRLLYYYCKFKEKHDTYEGERKPQAIWQQMKRRFEGGWKLWSCVQSSVLQKNLYKVLRNLHSKNWIHIVQEFRQLVSCEMCFVLANKPHNKSVAGKGKLHRWFQDYILWPPSRVNFTMKLWVTIACLPSCQGGPRDNKPKLTHDQDNSKPSPTK